MQYNLLLSISAVLAIVLAVLHFVALEFFLYWKFPWLDIFVHSLGGLLIALFAIWFYLRFATHEMPFSRREIAVVAMSAIIIAGISWELFELWAGLPREENFVSDTIVDLFMDLFGAFLGVIYVEQFYIPKLYNKYG